LLKRLRGAIKTGLTWGASWGVFGAVLHGVAVAFGWREIILPALIDDVLAFSALGLIGGTVYSAGLVLSERGRSIEHLRIGRFALWGLVAGLVGPVGIWILGGNSSWISLSTAWSFYVGTAMLGAGSGGTMAAIARAAARDALGDADPDAVLDDVASGVARV
jgi:hypothetical protein